MGTFGMSPDYATEKGQRRAGVLQLWDLGSKDLHGLGLQGLGDLGLGVEGGGIQEFRGLTLNPKP